MPKSPIRTRLCGAGRNAQYGQLTYPFENRIVWLHNIQGYRRSNSTKSCGQQQKGTCVRGEKKIFIVIEEYENVLKCRT